MSLKKIINGSAYLILEKLVRIFTGVLVGAWVARSFGPEEFSVYVNALNIFAFFQMVIGLGLDSVVVRNLVARESERNEIIRTAVSLKLIAAMVCIVGIMIYVFCCAKTRSEFNVYMIIALACMFLPLDVYDLYNQSVLNFKKSSLARLAGNLSGSAIKIAAILFSLDIIFVVSSLFIEFLIAGICFFASCKTIKVEFKIYQKIISEFAKECWPYMLSGLGVFIYTKFDQLLLNHIDDAKTLGAYGAILPFATALFFVPAMMSTVFAPYVTNSKMKSKRIYDRNIKYLYNVYGMLSWMILVINATIVIPAYQIILGENYQNTILTFLVYTCTIFFINIGIVQSLEIINAGRSKFALFKNATAAFCAIVANTILVPPFGMLGCAISALLAQMVSCWLVNAFFDAKLFKLQLFSLTCPEKKIIYRLLRYKYYAKRDTVY